jgi:hypothetical protein
MRKIRTETPGCRTLHPLLILWQVHGFSILIDSSVAIATTDALLKRFITLLMMSIATQVYRGQPHI